LDFWDEWFKRFGRRSPFFGDVDRMIKEMEREMAEIFKKMEKNMPRDMSKETRLPDGSVRRVYGPFVYGYSVKIGPDGKPVVREFGNMKPGLAREGSPKISLSDRREPLVDIIDDGESVKVLAELPGVEKKDIKLIATSDKLTINVDNPDRKYYKEIKFPTEIEASSAKSRYNNGILEISIKKKIIEDEKGTQLRIE
jgi:HSP20 family protein